MLIQKDQAGVRFYQRKKGEVYGREIKSGRRVSTVFL